MSPAKKPADKTAAGSAGRTTEGRNKLEGFTDEERSAMKDRIRELRAGADEQDGEGAVLAKIAAMNGPDREMGLRLHDLVRANAPSLSPRLWYGMPAYAKNGKVVCHFQPAQKFRTRYATFGFSDKANLDQGRVWPVAFALKGLTEEDVARLGALVKKAVA